MKPIKSLKSRTVRESVPDVSPSSLRRVGGCTLPGIVTPGGWTGSPPTLLHWTVSVFDGFAAVAAFAILAVSLTFRLLWLDRLPGINGDEAWYGSQILRCVRGLQWSGWTPTGLPINPLLFITEWLLLNCFEPNFWVLRLPIVIWSFVGLMLTYALYRWVYGRTDGAMLVLCLTACLPAHLAYSRFCWDGSFAFVSFPLLIFPLLRLLQGHRGKTEMALFFCGCIFAVWVHATHALLVAAALAVLVWEERDSWLPIARSHPITTLAVLSAVAIVALIAIRRSSLLKGLRESVASSMDRLPQHLAGLGEVMVGPRVFEYLAGVPMPGWVGPAIVIFYVAAGGLGFALWRWGKPTDRRLIVVSGLLLALVLILGRTLRLHRASYERYVLYMVPLLGLLVVQGVVSLGNQMRGRWAGPMTRLLPLCLSACCLIHFWVSYFAPLRDSVYLARQHRTFQSGPTEPKAVVADLIRSELSRSGERVTIYAEDWWLAHAIDYLLGGRHEIVTGKLPDSCSTPAIVIGFSGGQFVDGITAESLSREQLRAIWQVGGDADNRSVLTLLKLDRATSFRAN